VPLSEHEQKMLEQMEHALAAEDPRFASQMNGARSQAALRRRYILGAVGVLVGLALVLVGVNTVIWVGVVGFAVMVAGAAYALTPPRRRVNLGTVAADGSIKGRGPGRSKGGSSRKQGLMERLDERWERRQNDL